MSVGEAMRAPARELLPVAHVTLATGAELTWNAEDILSFSIQEGADSPLLPGNVISATCTLDLDNTSGQWLPGGEALGNGSLEEATVALALKVKDDGQWQSLSLGTYIITGISAPEQTPQMRLSCCDSIVTELAGSFTDGMTYPCTLSDLWHHAISQTRYVWQGTVPNGDAIIDAAPAWKDISLRQAMGYIAAAAGCFVRVNREGALDLVRCWTEAPQSTLSEEEYLTWTPEFDAYGPVDALKVIPVQNAEGVQTPLTVYVDASGASTGETVLVENNPLFQQDAAHLHDLAEGMLSQLAGLRLSSAKFNWRGDPAVGVGTRIRLTDTRGQAHDVTITRQTLQFDAGFSAACSCETPEATNAGVLRAITPEGGVNADALVGTVDGGLLAIGSITSKSIHAASVTTDKLAANAVTAEKLAANSVTADKLTAKSVTAEKLAAGAVEAQSIEAITAAINRITADDVSTNELYAAFAHLIQLSAGSISAGTIQTDQLAAALASFVALTAGTGEFDLATIKNLLSNALILEEGLAGSMMIRNLAVTSANMLNATVDKLVVKGPDGQYYRIHIDSDGGIRTEAVTVSQGEIAAGETDDGRQIVASTANVGSLNATTVKASEAILGTIFTESLNAGKITAGDAMLASATIPLLYATALKALGNTLDISANESIELIVGEVEQAKVYDSAEPPEEAPEAGKLWLDRGVTPPVMRRWRGVDVPAGRDFETAAAGNPLTVSNRGQVSEIAAQASCLAQQAGSGDPWPGGSGKNLFNIGTAVSANTSGSTVEVNGNTVRVYSTTAGMYHGMKSDAISLTAGTTYTLSGTATDIASGNVRLCVRKVSGNIVLSNSTILFSGTGSGSATFTPAEDVDAYVSVLVTWTTAEKGDATFENIQLEMGSTATAYVPWENIRAISGRESVEVRACGKNLLDDAQITPTNPANTTVTHDGHSIRIQGENAAYRDGRIIIYLPAGTYTIQADITVRSGVARITRRASTDGGKTYPSVVTDLSPVGANGYTFTVKPGAEWNMISFYVTWSEIESGDVTYADIRLYAGENASEYESYRNLGGGEIALSAPLYGLPGAEDTVEINVDGEAQAVRRTATTTLQTLYESTMNCAAGTYAYMRNIAGAAAKQDFAALCSHFKVLPWNSTSAQRVAGTMVAGITSSGAASVWMFATQATAAEFNAWLAEQVEAGTPVTLAYERATPQAEALEAVEPIAPQAGEMTILTDADGLSATLYGSGWETVNDTEDIREGVSENAGALYNLSSEFTQTRDAFEFRLNQTVNREEQSEYMRYGDGRLELGQSDSRYTAEISPEGGFVVRQEGTEMASMRKNTVSAPVLEARRMIQMGGNMIKLSASGGLIFN